MCSKVVLGSLVQLQFFLLSPLIFSFHIFQQPQLFLADGAWHALIMYASFIFFHRLVEPFSCSHSFLFGRDALPLEASQTWARRFTPRDFLKRASSALLGVQYLLLMHKSSSLSPEVELSWSNIACQGVRMRTFAAMRKAGNRVLACSTIGNPLAWFTRSRKYTPLPPLKLQHWWDLNRVPLGVSPGSYHSATPSWFFVRCACVNSSFSETLWLN